MKQDLLATKILMEDDSNYNKLKLKHLNTIIYNIDNKVPYRRNMDTIFRAFNAWASPFPVMTAYEIFKDKGVETIKNKKIKEKTITLYDSTFIALKDDYDRAEWALFESVTNPFIVKHFSYDSLYDETVLSPNNYEELVDNPEFKNLATFVKHLRTSGLTRYSSTIDEIQELIELIESELK